MLNKVTFQGRFTADPIMKQTPSGVSYCNFDVAWSEKYKEVESTCFLKCRAWRTTAEFLPKYFRKGDQVIVEGRLITNSWTDDQGQKRSTIICDVEKCHFCGSKGTQGGAQTGFVTDYSGIQGGYAPTSPQNAAQGAGTQNASNYLPAQQNAATSATATPAQIPTNPNFEVVSENDALPF